ncbi:NAD-dependent epimerase/dehydratase family protein [Pseudomonas sp. NFACC08-1]|uniref:NAD-dependent epimerase/dehydratase family protein n=1 Tax=Pseudomonas sp. NFACC08-1 TaxID=1566238 RepID=UPI00089BC482|nr:NAD-dependent epimerase/dehydratase family protein [Pseudomonas sp. NFACC08-1]SDX22550.1 Nucleoside-diphosphate-sugar epimerase [Pseudomonas sp. NFACC08-1]
MKVLVTGASGYIGRELCRELGKKDEVLGVGRSALVAPVGFNYKCSDLQGDSLVELFAGYDCVVHLAGKAHIVGRGEVFEIESFRDANKNIAVRVAKAAIEAGIKRFVFISSIGVNGASTSGCPFSEMSTPQPTAAYSITKYEAEISLRELVSNSSMDLVVVRPPLVYSYNAPGNFSRLLRLVSLGIPLPLGAVKNSRSMIALENLIDFIKVCLTHKSAANEIFLVSDRCDVSTPEVVKYLAQGMRKKILMLPIPNPVMRRLMSVVGKKSMYMQLCGSLVVDSSKAQRLLGWEPPYNAIQCLIEAGRRFKTRKC